MMDEKIQEEFERSLRLGTKPKAKSTITKYVRGIKRFEEWLGENRTTEDGAPKTLWDANSGDLQRYLEDLRAHDYAPKTVGVHRGLISTFYQEMGSRNLDDELGIEVPANPADGYTDAWGTRKTKKGEGTQTSDPYYYLTPEEIDALKDNVPAPRLRNELIVLLMYTTGIRRGELARIKVEDIDGRDIYIEKQKTENSRYVRFPPADDKRSPQHHLDLWLNDGRRDAIYYADESEYLFPTEKSTRIRDNTISDVIRRAAENAGLQKEVGSYADDPNGNPKATGRKIRKISSHTLRHSFAVQAAKSGLGAAEIAFAMGHEDDEGNPEVETTQIYLKMASTDKLDAYDKWSSSASALESDD